MYPRRGRGGMGLPKIGSSAPPFALPDGSGATISLKQLRGTRVVLYFYPKDDTPGCTVEACEFRDNLAAVQKAGAAVLGVSKDSVERHRNFGAKFSLGFPLLADEETRVIRSYGVWQEKSLYGRKFMGIVRTTFLIDERGRVAAVFEKVRPKGHAAEVLAALKQLGPVGGGAKRAAARRGTR